MAKGLSLVMALIAIFWLVVLQHRLSQSATGGVNLMAQTGSTFLPIFAGSGSVIVETPSHEPAPTPSAVPSQAGSPTPTILPTATSIAEPEPTVEPSPLENFEQPEPSWRVNVERNDGQVTRSEQYAASGNAAARAVTNQAGAIARVGVQFVAPAGERIWEERPGVWHWQRASLYVPSATIANLSGDAYITIGGMWAETAGYGWFLRVRENGALSVVGQRHFDNQAIEFSVYGTFPTDRWVSLEMGLHSQNGPGVKRAFAFLIDGYFYGWYRQGRMQDETYSHVAMGILDTNSAQTFEVFIDDWRILTTDSVPHGPDRRSSAAVQTQDFRTAQGIQWQIDWTTWDQDLRLHSGHGLYSARGRLQSGRNLDRMPDLTNGWAEIEIDWPQGVPEHQPTGYFGPMVGFRKEVNREQNLEIIPIGRGDGTVDLVFEAWVGEPVILARWPLPAAAIGEGSHIPEPGDIIRVQWRQISVERLTVQASYFDASTGIWHRNIIDNSFDISAVQSGNTVVDYTDGFHTASSITIDSPFYAIRRYTVGTIDTFPIE